MLFLAVAIVLALRRLLVLRRKRRAITIGSSIYSIRDASKQWINDGVANWYAFARATLAHRVEKQVEVALNTCADHARRRIKDPAMPHALQRAIDVVLDSLLPDIKHESYRVLDEHLHFLQAAQLTTTQSPASRAFSPLSPRRSSPPRHRASSGSSSGSNALHADVADRSQQNGADTSAPMPLVQLLRRLRAGTLHTLWPHDSSMWLSFRSVRWWLLTLLGMAPHGIGASWWLLLAISVDKQDEYQLCQFIVALRCTHFFTLGVGAALYGCFQAYRCVAFSPASESISCRALAPTLTPFAAVFWLAQLLITIRAYVLLPHSKKKGQRVWERRSRLSLEVRRALAAGQQPPPEAASSMARAQPGGVLVHMGMLDLALAALVVVAISVASIAFCSCKCRHRTQQPRLLHARRAALSLLLTHSPPACLATDHDVELLRTNLFWVRTAHGLLSCPYVLLRLPGANTLLTHARRTGYDQLGHCVPWNGRRRDADSLIAADPVAPAAQPNPQQARAIPATAQAPTVADHADDAPRTPAARRLFTPAPAPPSLSNSTTPVRSRRRSAHETDPADDDSGAGVGLNHARWSGGWW